MVNHPDPGWIEYLKNYGATPLAGDLRDPIFLSDLFLGVNAVIISPIFLPTGKIGQIGIFNLINEATITGVLRLVFLSFADPHEENIAQDKTNIEQWIIKSGVSYTILHAGVHPDLVNGSITQPNRQAMIKDLARWVTCALQDPQQLNAIVEPGNPAGDPGESMPVEIITGHLI